MSKNIKKVIYHGVEVYCCVVCSSKNSCLACDYLGQLEMIKENGEYKKQSELVKREVKDEML